MTAPLHEFDERKKKLADLQEMGVQAYPERYEKSHQTQELLKDKKVCDVEELKAEPKSTYSLAGRLTMFREHGKLSFAHLLDDSGKIQLAFMQDVIGKDAYVFLQKKMDIGDFIGVKGDLFLTKHGEITLLVSEYTFLGKALRPLPEKYHGLVDKEKLYRQRYLDLIANPDTKKRFEFRSNFIRYLREFYWSENFIEVETPVLTNSASGALATPFITHHRALDTDVFLRIAPETYLKECIIGGFEKVFEIGRIFRNEGIDPSHLQDFTMLEHYGAYWNFEDNIAFTEKMFTYIFKSLGMDMKIDILDRDGNVHSVDFTPSWPRVTLRELILKDSGIDIGNENTKEKLMKAIKDKKIHIEKLDNLGFGNMVDHLYKSVSRPKLIHPTFVTGHPIELSPLARKNDTNPNSVDRFQLVVGTWEIVNAYSELVDPQDQAERFDAQAMAKNEGDHEAHSKDDDYIKAMEYGMPPISGFGMGIDRIVAILTQSENLRDVVLFPLMRPEANEEDE